MNIRPDPDLFFDPSKCFIGGRWIAPAGGDYLAVENPSDGTTIGRIPRGTKADIDAAVAAAQSALDGVWGRTPAAERGRILSRIGMKVLERVDDLARIEALDVGKPLKQARADALALARYMEFYGGAADKVMGETIPYLDGYTVYTLRQPHGVTGHIIPWNYPMQILGRSVGAALCMGNAVVLKPAEEACLTAIAFAQIAQEAGLPDGALNVVPGLGEEAGAALTTHPGVHHISFTGSVSVGQMIQRATAQNIVPLTLELGGKSPQLVFPDADLGAACEAIIWSFCSNAGQICTAGTRALVHADVYDEVVGRLADLVRRVRVGDPMDDATHVGPLASRRGLEKVAAMVERGKKEARLVVGGERVEGLPGYYFQPTIFADVAPSAELFQEEVFGPVLSVTPFRDEDHAVALANDAQYALASNVWTADLRRALRIAEQIDAGTVWCGTSRLGDPHMPLRAAQKSGGSHYRGLVDVFTREKLVAVSLRDEDRGPHWALATERAE